MTAFPANLYFRPEIGEHDVTLTSFTNDLLHADHFPSVNMRQIDMSEGTESFLAIFALLHEILPVNESGNSPPPQ